ncbi:MAG: (2Fe-2S)-binding protein [Clostridia bacterium]|nr:(2Fe-2S)-binding protein [Clostridia bacterium]
MIQKDGIATQEMIDSITPSAERRSKGPVAVVECFQSIPCNPCYTSCPRKAMKELIDINDMPQVNTDICNGCGVCISHCPGLAIFVIDETYGDNQCLIKMPYEFTPLPSEGDYVTATDRGGKPVCRGKVVKVVNTPMQDRTPIIHLVVPKEFSMIVRSLNINDIYDDNTYICRCEELTLGELREYIRKGYTTLDEIKRITRAGMGPCQGRTCRQLIMNEIAKLTGVKPQDQLMSTFRPPVKPVKLGFYAQEDTDNE